MAVVVLDKLGFYPDKTCLFQDGRIKRVSSYRIKLEKTAKHFREISSD